MKYTVQETTILHRSSISPEDFFLLLCFVSRKPKEYFIAHPEHRLSEYAYRKLSALVQRRINHEPIAFITGHKEFYGFDFLVNRSTLIPRPETESLIESAIKDILEHISPHSSSQYISEKPIIFIDVGTGSGNILLSILKTLEKETLLPKLSCFGLDTSEEAIILAKKNARRLRPFTRARFVQSDLLQALPTNTFRRAAHAYIFANLPYLSEKIYQTCPPDVKDYEPASALTSMALGCAHIEKLLREIAILHTALRKLPFDIWLEISPEQKRILTKKIRSLFPESQLEFQKDLSQKYRFVHIMLRT